MSNLNANSNKAITTTLIVLAIIALVLWRSNTWCVIKKDKFEFYKKLEHAMSVSKTDTIIVNDTVHVDKPSKPQIIWRDSIVEVPVLDSTMLDSVLKSHFAKVAYHDSINFGNQALLTLLDTVSQNTITSRQANLTIFKTDTIYKTVTNNIIEPSKPTPRNFVDAQFGIVQNDMQLYELSYMRQFGSKAFQWRLGCGVGNIWTDSNNDWFVAVKFGVAF